MIHTNRSSSPSRWRTTLILMVILALLPAAAGWLSVRPLYVTNGLVAVIPELPVVYRELPAHRISNVASFLDGERTALRGPRLTSRALGLAPREVQLLLDLGDDDRPQDSMAGLGLADDPVAFETLMRDRVAIRTRPGTTTIEVRCAAESAEESYVVVQSLLAACQETRADEHGESLDRMTNALRREASMLETRIREDRMRLARDLDAGGGLVDENGVVAWLDQALREIQRERAEIGLALADAGCVAADGSPGPSADTAECRTLRAEGERLAARADALLTDRERASRLAVSIDERRRTIAAVEQRHAAIRERLADLNLEFEWGFDRMRVIPAGRPHLPAEDDRAIRASIAGGAGVLVALLLHGIRSLAGGRRPSSP